MEAIEHWDGCGRGGCSGVGVIEEEGGEIKGEVMRSKLSSCDRARVNGRAVQLVAYGV